MFYNILRRFSSMFSKTIKPLVCKNFEVIQNESQYNKIKNNIVSLSNDKTYFLYKNETAYQIYQKNNSNELFHLKVPIIKADTSLDKSISSISDHSYALVKDETTIRDYLSPSVIMKTIIEEYEKQKQFIQTILQTSENSYTAIDKNSNVVYWSKGAEKLFEIKKEHIIGKPITNFFVEKNLEILNTLYHDSTVQRHQHQARNDLVVLINSNPVKYRDKTIGAVVSEEDITSQIRLNNELYKTSENLFTLEKEIKKSTDSLNPFVHIRGNSAALNKTKDFTEKVASTDAAVVIHGESGGGKELFAKAIHDIREKNECPYVAINCGAISSRLLESEIFGYERSGCCGSNSKGKKGKAQLAKGGTLFLDEIGEMPLEMQVKFLRLLQEKKFYPVVGTKEVEADFRVIAATSRKLTELIEKGE